MALIELKTMFKESGIRNIFLHLFKIVIYVITQHLWKFKWKMWNSGHIRYANIRISMHPQSLILLIQKLFVPSPHSNDRFGLTTTPWSEAIFDR